MHLNHTTLAILAPVAALNVAITARAIELNHHHDPKPSVAAAVPQAPEPEPALPTGSMRSYYVGADGYVSQRKALIEAKHGGCVYTLRAHDTADATLKTQRAHSAGRFTYSKEA